LHSQATCSDRESFDVFYIPRLIGLCAQSLTRVSASDTILNTSDDHAASAPDDSATKTSSPHHMGPHALPNDVCTVVISSEEPHHELLASAIASLQFAHHTYSHQYTDDRSPLRRGQRTQNKRPSTRTHHRVHFRIRVHVVDDAKLHAAFVSLLPDAHAYVAAQRHSFREGVSASAAAADTENAYSVDERLIETDAAAARSLGADGRLYDLRYVMVVLTCFHRTGISGIICRKLR
jgi:hypothetical protein